MDVQAFVLPGGPRHYYRAGRTFRSLTAARIPYRELSDLTPRAFRKILAAQRPVLFARAGVWLTNPQNYCTPSPSSLGKPLCAFGAIRPRFGGESLRDTEAATWANLLRQTGGDFSGLGDPLNSLRSLFRDPPVLFLDARACARLHEAGVASLADAATIACQEFRLVHYPPLDVYDGHALRVLQVITALQRGGAERIALDLHAELPAHGCVVRLATLGRAAREAFPAPDGTLDCAQLASDLEDRLGILQQQSIAFGTDIIHAHLLSREELCSLSSAGFPVVATLHNTRAGWPAGTLDLKERDTALLVACSAAVEQEVRAAKLALPLRTVRNGIALDRFRPTAECARAGREWRSRWGFADRDLILISLANPRRQKRLHLLPAVLAAARTKLGPHRSVRLIFCGEAAPGNGEAERCVRETQVEIERLGLDSHVRWIGSHSNTEIILAAADILVSTSAHEGLSLAQLEALASGCHVVATNVGGAREIASNVPQCQLLPADATAEEFAAAIGRAAHDSGARGIRNGFLPKVWSSHCMAAQYARLYRGAIARTRRASHGDGVWLITNNFSTGGAQSSARRLLAGLAAQGESVRAAVVEEQPDHPTPGRQALLASGIPVFAAAPDETPAEAVKRILAEVDRDWPRAVVFWNLRPAIKLLLAEALCDVAVFDVSPGEMYFQSLERCFESNSLATFARTPREYGSRLAGVIVKYRAEAERAERLLCAPVHVVPNGVPLHTFVPRTRAADSPAIVFGTAARINPQKRLEDLLLAFRRVHDVLPGSVLRIAGGVEYGCGSYAAELRAIAAGLPVSWEGEISDLIGFHASLDIFVMISDPAGCPNASLEAIAAGLPVIATDVGGAAEQVINGVTGSLVPSRDIPALSEAMIGLGRAPELCRVQGEAGRTHIAKNFSLDAMVANYRQIFLPRDRDPAI